MNLSDAIKEAYEYAPADVVFYDTLEISHRHFADSIRIVRSYQPLTTNQGVYLPIHFDLTLPETEGGVRGVMTIAINFLNKESRTAIRQASTSRYPVEIIYRQYIDTSKDPDVIIPVPLQVTSIKETFTGIEAQAMLPDLVGAYFPRRLMTTEILPGAII